MPPEETERVKRILSSNETKPFSLLECYLMHKDGYHVPVEISGDSILDERGEFKGYRGITRNVSRRQKPKK